MAGELLVSPFFLQCWQCFFYPIL